MSSYENLVKKLKEIFQIDQADLDFGLYRIMRSRSEDINRYLDKGLKAKVEESLKQAALGDSGVLKAELEEAVKGAAALGVAPEAVPKVQELRERLDKAVKGSNDYANEVFAHLATFFGRYYDKGDFISRRRYKGDTYAIPYDGEEVVLHWANKDQYYTKSGEQFSNYAFALKDGNRVHFRVLAAQTSKDNRKDDDKERRFVLATDHVTTIIDEDGEEIEESVPVLRVEDGELFIHFR
jgi:adenine-specific DNA-methyltransferase